MSKMISWDEIKEIILQNNTSEFTPYDLAKLFATSLDEKKFKTELIQILREKKKTKPIDPMVQLEWLRDYMNNYGIKRIAEKHCPITMDLTDSMRRFGMIPVMSPFHEFYSFEHYKAYRLKLLP